MARRRRHAPVRGAKSSQYRRFRATVSRPERGPHARLVVDTGTRAIASIMTGGP
jgi:hypothetical protein